MRLLSSAALAGLGIALPALFSLPAIGAESCALKQLASLPVSPSNGHAIIVPVSINGTELKFGLASSSNASYLLAPVAEKLQLPIKDHHGQELYAAGSQLSPSNVIIREFKIGENVGHDFEMFLINDSSGSHKNYDGALGSNFLWQFDIEVNLLEGKVNLFDRDHCDGKVIYWSDTYFRDNFYLTQDKQVVLYTLINNTKMNATLNLGSSSTKLSWIAAKKLGITEDSPGIEEIEDIEDFNGKKIKNYKYKLDSIEIGGEKLSKFPVYISGNGISTRAATGSNVKDHDYDGDVQIGVDFLMFNRIYISNLEHQIYFTPYNGDQIKSIYAKYKS